MIPTVRLLTPAGMAAALVSLLAFSGCGDNGQPPAIEVHRDAQGEHIHVNNEQVRKDLNQAGNELQRGARQLGQEVREGARKVDEEVGPAAREAALTARVKTRLIAAPDLGGIHINVDNKDGEITLRGTVASQDRRQDAEKITARTPGVKSVNNQLEVVPGGGG